MSLAILLYLVFLVRLDVAAAVRSQVITPDLCARASWGSFHPLLGNSTALLYVASSMSAITYTNIVTLHLVVAPGEEGLGRYANESLICWLLSRLAASSSLGLHWIALPGPKCNFTKCSQARMAGLPDKPHLRYAALLLLHWLGKTGGGGGGERESWFVCWPDRSLSLDLPLSALSGNGCDIRLQALRYGSPPPPPKTYDYA